MDRAMDEAAEEAIFRVGGHTEKPLEIQYVWRHIHTQTHSHPNLQHSE